VLRHSRKVKSRKGIPWWLNKLDLVRAELRAYRFPRTTEEGIRQCAELSYVSMQLFKEEVRKSLHTKSKRQVQKETRRLTAHFSRIDQKWKPGRSEARVTPERA
jgi:hypothetical protein